MLDPFSMFQKVKNYVSFNHKRLKEKGNEILKLLKELEYKLLQFSEKIELLMS